MNKKFLVSLTLVVGLGITGFATTAYAGNTEDKLYTFNFSSSGSVAYTQGSREKQDATSAYMQFINMSSSGGRYRAKVVDSNGNDFSRIIWSRYFYESTPSATATFIGNYAYEDRGYGVLVKLKAEGDGGTGIWTTNGWWSPDSVGEN